MLKGQWNASGFFQALTRANKFCRDMDFKFCPVSGLDGLEQALQLQQANNFVFMSDTSDGYIELNNTPKTRRVKTVFLAMRHKVDDLYAREACLNIMREIFRQFMSRLIPEKVRLENNFIFIDDRITFHEIDRYFFTGCACAFFQVSVDIFTDLRLNDAEWDSPVTYDAFTCAFGPEFD